jgi:hypothetical protein
VAADAVGTLRLHRNEINPSDHKISIGAETGIEVRSLTLDSLVDDSGRGRISLIKIDVQGAEMMVLAGACKTLSMRDLALFIEVDDGALRRFGSSAEELVAFLDGHGFHMHQLIKDGAARPLDRAALRENLARRGYVDVLFLRETPARTISAACSPAS